MARAAVACAAVARAAVANAAVARAATAWALPSSQPPTGADVPGPPLVLDEPTAASTTLPPPSLPPLHAAGVARTAAELLLRRLRRSRGEASR